MDAGVQHDTINISNPERRVSLCPFSKTCKSMKKEMLLPLLIASGAGMHGELREAPEHVYSMPTYMNYNVQSVSGYSGIVGNGKSRKKKTNKLHRSRMLKRKHARK